MSDILSTEAVRFVKELYPRLKQDDAAIERYRAALDRLPPIVVARDGVLVDGFHRWQAHLAEGSAVVAVENLGNLTDLEIRKESLRRNSSHGRQLETKDKRKQAGELYLLGVDEAELVELLSLRPDSLTEYLRDAKRDQKQQRQAQAWDLWLSCWTQEAIAAEVGVTDRTIRNWLDPENSQWIGKFPDGPPSSRQHFDLWQFILSDDESNYFGKLFPQIVENLLWLFTEPGQIVVDPFAGGGTTIDVAKAMGRRVWASDRKPHSSRVAQDIHQHDITTGWPTEAPNRVDFILLDPPYWKQAAGRYSDDPEDLGNMPLPAFYDAWANVVKACDDHLTDNGRIAFITSPAQDGPLAAGHVVDLAFDMYGICVDHGWTVDRRIVAAYNAHDVANGQQVEAAREHRKLLKQYRDIVVMRP